jgi:hypothetical protein
MCIIYLKNSAHDVVLFSFRKKLRKARFRSNLITHKPLAHLYILDKYNFERIRAKENNSKGFCWRNNNAARKMEYRTCRYMYTEPEFVNSKKPRNRFLGSLNGYKFGLWCATILTTPGGLDPKMAIVV